MKIIMSICFIFGISMPLFCGPGNSYLKKYVENIFRLKSYTAEIDQVISDGRGGVEKYSGRITVSTNGRINILYRVPEVQRVVYDGRRLMWYFPETERVFIYKGRDAVGKTGIFNLKNDAVTQLKMKYMGTVFYGFFNRAHVFRFSGGRNRESRLWIDADKGVAVRKFVLDSKGREILSERYGQYSDVNSVKLPGSIVIYMRNGNHVIKTTTRYSKIRVNIEPDESLFRFKVLNKMKVKEIGF